MGVHVLGQVGIESLGTDVPTPVGDAGTVLVLLECPTWRRSRRSGTVG